MTVDIGTHETRTISIQAFLREVAAEHPTLVAEPLEAIRANHR